MKKGYYSISLDEQKKEVSNLWTKRIVKHSLFLLPLFTLPAFLFLVISTFITAANPQSTYAKNINNVNSGIYTLFTTPAKFLTTSSTTFTSEDPRPVIIKQFFAKHKAPLSEYADFIVSEADSYKIDWRLIPAIGMCESNGGKNIPEDSFNAWGWAASEKDLAEKSGHYNNETWEKGITRVTKGIATGYYYLINPEDGIDFDEIWTIMKKYTPPSVAKGGPWAKCVWQYYTELTEFQTPVTK